MTPPLARLCLEIMPRLRREQAAREAAPERRRGRPRDEFGLRQGSHTSQAAALMCRQGAVTHTELMELLGVGRGTASTICRRLVEHGIARHSGPARYVPA